MESSHFLGSIKSSYLTTLIFSYYQYLDEVQAILKMIGKRGSSFIENNINQLKFFCVVKTGGG